MEVREVAPSQHGFCFSRKRHVLLGEKGKKYKVFPWLALKHKYLLFRVYLPTGFGGRGGLGGRGLLAKTEKSESLIEYNDFYLTNVC